MTGLAILREAEERDPRGPTGSLGSDIAQQQKRAGAGDGPSGSHARFQNRMQPEIADALEPCEVSETDRPGEPQRN